MMAHGLTIYGNKDVPQARSIEFLMEELNLRDDEEEDDSVSKEEDNDETVKEEEVNDETAIYDK